VFRRYKAIVEKYFQHSIVSFYSDNGGEYIALKPFLSEHGISHLTSPPHMPEHKVILHGDIFTLSKLVLPFFLMPPFQLPFGLMPSPLLFT